MLEIGIRRIGNNINQIAFVANASSKVLFEDVNFFKAQLLELEKIISKAFRNPQTLEETIKKEVLRSPRIIQLLKDIIKTIEHDS